MHHQRKDTLELISPVNHLLNKNLGKEIMKKSHLRNTFLDTN